jgi:hypothetical protein
MWYLANLSDLGLNLTPLLLLLLKISRCFSSYPDGEASIVPQIFTLMAAVSTIMAFDIVKIGTDSSTRNFMCKEIAESGGTTECIALRLSDQEYYNQGDRGWANAARVGAFVGIIAAIAGFFSFALLSTGTCFALKPRRLLVILVLQAAAAFFSMLSLVAGAVDVCGAGGRGTGCGDKRARIDTGAGFMLAASFLFMGAIAATGLYWTEVRKNDDAPVSKDRHETETLTSGDRAHDPTETNEDVDV